MLSRSAVPGFGRALIGCLFSLFSLIAGAAAPGDQELPAYQQELGWPTYHNDFAGQRYSPLAQINTANLAGLREICRLQLAEGGSFQTNPIVVNGTMFLTTTLETFAVDPTNCQLRWKAVHRPAGPLPWAANRGVAYLNGRLYRGTPDGQFFALDAQSGKTVWMTQVADTAYGEFITAAPQAWNGLVFIGVSGGDWGVRGRMLAFEADTGREAWRFDLIPRQGETGAETWKRPSTRRTGGGGTWSSYSIDIRSGEIFVPVGNPAQFMHPDAHPGDNLFTNSVVALDARTGKLKWWHQTAKNDPWDYDVVAPPMLYQNRRVQEVAAIAGKDGYLVGVDRDTRKVLYRTPTTTHHKEAARPTPQGAKACPGWTGGTQWNGPAYEPEAHLVIVGAVDWCTVYKRGPADFERGKVRFGGQAIPVMDPAPSGWITAVDAESGVVSWRVHTQAPVVAAITPTAGGVVFAGDVAGNFLAVGSKTGEILWQRKLDGALGGGIVTYAVDAKQYVATAMGNVSRVTFGGTGNPTLVVWGLAP